MTTLAATGVFRLSWLLLAFPVFGAAVLLLGGRRTDKWGHLLAVLMSLASFVYGVIAFFALLGKTGAARSQDLHVYSWIPVNGFQANIGILIDPLSIFARDTSRWVGLRVVRSRCARTIAPSAAVISRALVTSNGNT